MCDFKFSTEDYILYILNKLEPDKSDKTKLNKIAFFVEFAYLLSKSKELSEAEYAAITYGPAINDYNYHLENLSFNGKVKIDGYKLRPLTSPATEPNEEIQNFIDPLIEKYSNLTNKELIALSHLTDSWLISTDNGKNFGTMIDKDLASLETFFLESHNGTDDDSNEELDEDLPKYDKESLVDYEFD